MNIEDIKEAIEKRVVKTEHDKQIEIAQAYERGWNAALAQQEPVAWMGAHDKTDLYYRKPPQADVIPLYTTPPPRKPWVGLTGDEVNEFAAGCHLGNSVQGAIRKAEAKLKERNA